MKPSKALMETIDQAVGAAGFECFGVEVMSQNRNQLLRIYIDSPEGVTVDHCGVVSKQIVAAMTVAKLDPGAYTLEVSSPGLDRPLFKPAHYAQQVGKLISVKLHAPFEGRSKFKGRLVSVQEDAVVFEREGETSSFSLSDIKSARVVPEF